MHAHDDTVHHAHQLIISPLLLPRGAVQCAGQTASHQAASQS
jgi:hypothetical protein